jgi:hypothetical protein
MSASCGRHGLGGGLARQTLDGGRRLRADALPVSQAILRDAQTFLTFGGTGVVEANALDEAAIATHALIGNQDAVERATFGAAARETNNDHEKILWVGGPGKARLLPMLRHATDHPASDTSENLALYKFGSSLPKPNGWRKSLHPV